MQVQKKKRSETPREDEYYSDQGVNSDGLSVRETLCLTHVYCFHTETLFDSFILLLLSYLL